MLHIVGALMTFVILQKIADRFNRKNVSVKISQQELDAGESVYQQVIYIFITRLNGLFNPYLLVDDNFVVAMAVSLLISFILLEFKWTRIMIGEKT